MNIQIKFLAVLVCFVLGAANSMVANPSTGLAVFQPPPSCDLTAPIDLHVTELAPNFIRVDWTPTSIPFEQNIKVVEVATGNIVQNSNIPGNATFARVGNIQDDIEYDIINTPVCSDGTLSKNSVSIRIITPIIELVVSGFTPSTLGWPYTFDAKYDYCIVNPPPGWSVTCMVKQTSGSGTYFAVHKTFDDSCKPRLKIKTLLSSEEFQLFCSSGQTNACLTNEITIKKQNGLEVSKFKLVEEEGTLQMICTYMLPGYEIKCWGPKGIDDAFDIVCTGLHDPGPGGDRNSNASQGLTPTLSAQPNPFTDQLEIQLPFNNPTENTRISLYDLQGRQVISALYPGEQQTIQLSTLNLAPGMYFLRAESGGVSETVKVVRTQ